MGQEQENDTQKPGTIITQLEASGGAVRSRPKAPRYQRSTRKEQSAILLVYPTLTPW
jgi:hypothetical protein